MTDLMSPNAFKWFVTLLTGGVAASWAIYDLRNLIVVRNADGSNAIVRDRRFGYMIGIVIGILGVIGCLRFHDVL